MVKKLITFIVFTLIFTACEIHRESDNKVAKPIDEFYYNVVGDVENIKNKINEYTNIEEKQEDIEEKKEDIEEKKEERVEEIEERPHIDGLKLGEDIQNYLYKRTLKEDIAYTLMLAIIGVESDYGRDVYSVNKNGTHDGGLTQINSRNVKWLGKLANIKNPDVYDYKDNIDMAIELIKYERDFWREQGYSEEDVFWLTVYSYNRGRGNAIKMAKRDVWESSYVNKVMREKERLEMNVIG